MKAEDSSDAQVRSNFTFNFLIGAKALSKIAEEIDKKGNDATETERLQHRAFVAGSIMQSVSALESEVWTLLNYGPGHHLDKDDQDLESKRILSIVSKCFDKKSIMIKYDMVLQLFRGKKLDCEKERLQDLKLVIELRNEITHFKSFFTNEMDSKKLFKKLQKKDSKPPSFYPHNGMNFFPNICLTFRRSEWALKTVILFIDYYYKELELKSPLDILDRQLITI